MPKKYKIREKIERNGLILIALFMVLIYWVIDSLSSDQVFTRTMIVGLVIVYGILDPDAYQFPQRQPLKKRKEHKNN